MPRKSLHPHSASSRSVQCFFPFHFSPWLGSCPASCHLVAPVLAPLLPPPRLALQPRLPRPPSDSPLVPAETDLLVGGRGLLLQSRESTLPALSGTGLWSSGWEPRETDQWTRGHLWPHPSFHRRFGKPTFVRLEPLCVWQRFSFQKLRSKMCLPQMLNLVDTNFPNMTASKIVRPCRHEIPRGCL